MNTGWKPLAKPKRPRVDLSAPQPHSDGGRFAVSPFVRLSRVHALSAAGDAMITVALAGSLFFSIDPSAARWRVGLYLALTIAPFALISPLIGPALDRAKGGRRMMIVAINIARCVVAFMMVGNLDSLLLFPLTFAVLVLQKGYAIAKAAVVPTTVKTHHELIEKNSRLALLAGVAGFTGAAPAALAQWIGGPSWSVFLAGLVFAAAVAASWALPRAVVATGPEQEIEKRELRSGGIIRAASTMGVLRGVMGFFSFLVAFAYRGGTDDLDLSGRGSALGARLHEEILDVDLNAGGTSAVRLGAVIACTVLGGLAGSLAAPPLRDRISEENILFGATGIIASFAMVGVWSGGLGGAVLVGFSVGIGVAAARLAFDSIVQRDAPDANYGRSFARFETRFQLSWVIGALIPVVLTIPARVGFLIMSVAAGVSAFSFFMGTRVLPSTAPLRVAPPAPQPLDVDQEVDATTIIAPEGTDPLPPADYWPPEPDATTRAGDPDPTPQLGSRSDPDEPDPDPGQPSLF